MFSVEIIYATLSSQELLRVEVEPGSSIEDCIRLSHVLEKFPEIDLAMTKVGIFSQIKPLTHEVRSGDRIEIYRPLIADPKAVRRKKAAQAKK